MATPDAESPVTDDLESTLRARIAQFRSAVPEGVITTDLQHADSDRVAVRAIVATPGGGRGSGIAAAEVGEHDWADVVELTELRAISRALTVLAPGGDRPRSAGAPPRAPQQRAPVAPVRPAESPDEPPMAEYSWTAFWPAAHARNISREQVASVLGKSPQQASPREAIEALRAAGLWAAESPTE